MNIPSAVTMDLAPICVGAARPAATSIVITRKMKLVFMVEVLDELRDGLRWIILLFAEWIGQMVERLCGRRLAARSD